MVSKGTPRSSSSRTRSRTPAKRASSAAASADRGAEPTTPRTRAAANAAALDAPAASPVVPRRFTPQKDAWDGKFEFGGWPGCLAVMAFSHCIMYYFWICIDFYQGQLVYPGHALVGPLPPVAGLDSSSYLSAPGGFLQVMWGHVVADAVPTPRVFAQFCGFLLMQYALAVVLPGPVTYGLPVPSENGHRFRYKCNAVYVWYVLIALMAWLHHTELFPLWELRENFGRFMTSAVVWANAVSVACYVAGLRRAVRMSGSLVYDFFMGSGLNPRLPGDIDLKLFAEIRNSWMLLFLLTCSCAAKMAKENGGTITGNMWFMVVAHLLYVNACQKGEECIPTTWDIYYEKFGWMLIFWNFAGVPFVYCFQSLFIQRVLGAQSHPTWALVLLFALLLPAYYIWDNVNSQKNRFRMKRQGVDEAVIRRRTFPQLWWGYIEHPRTIKSDRGELFVDGWYRYGRKIHYTVDMTMSFLWGASCGFTHFIPFFYFVFFFSHLMHREARDEERCRRKYGPLWDRYLKVVPYKFIPGVY